MLNASILPFLSTNYLVGVFVGSFLFGETVIITIATLAVSFGWPFVHIFWVALLGTVASDTVWFYLGRGILRRLRRFESYERKHEKMMQALQRYAGEKPFLALLYIKFLYGTRIITMLYLSLRRVPVQSFILFDTIGSAIWLFVVMSLGWLAGLGIMNLLPELSRLEYILVAALAVVVITKLITVWSKQRFLNSG